MTRYSFVLLPVAAAVAVYAGTLGAEFVYDDSAQIVTNPWVRELRNLPQAVARPVWAFQTDIPTNYYRPLQMGAYNLMWAAGGGRPFLFHLANVLFHAAATAALAGLVRRVTGDRLVAGGAALLFAVHPLNSEAVAWIACLPEVAYTCFGLAALSLHFAAWDASGTRRLWRRAAEIAAFALAILSKETAVVLPVLVFLSELWIRRPASRLAAVKTCIPYAAVVLAYTVLRLAAVGGVAPLARPDLTAWDALLNAPWLLLAYLGKMVWPARLVAYHVFDPIHSVAQPAFYLALLALAGIVSLVIWLSRRRGDLAWAAAMALLPFAPVLYVPALGLNAFAERYAYLPTAGFAWLVAAGVLALAARLAQHRARAVAAIAITALSLPAAARTVLRARVWHDDERLASTTVRQSPRSRVMWSLLAGVYRTSGRPEEALRVCELALAQFPGDPLIRAESIGLELTRRSIVPAEAVRRLQAILSAGSETYEIHVYLGQAQRMAGDPAAAERSFRRAIELNPSSKPAYDGLALALIAQGALDTGPAALLEGAGFSLGGEMDLLIEGAAHLKTGRLDQAQRAFEAILREHPDSAGAMFSLGVVAARRADHESAIAYCRRAVAERPELVDAHQQIGSSAMALGRLDEAIAAFERAAAMSPFDKALQNRLGVAYARAARFDDARRAFERALELDPGFAGARSNLERLESQR